MSSPQTSTPLAAFSLASARKSPLSPNNIVATELRSDPKATSDLLRDINKALQSPVPSPAEYVRRLEAELSGAASGTPRQARTSVAGGSSSAAAGGGSDQPAKDLVASLERMLQQPAAATPGRRALSILRQSQAAEVGAGLSRGGSMGAELAAAASFSRSRFASIAAAEAAALTGSSAAPAASRWRSTDRAASFKVTPPAAAVSRGSSTWREAGGMPGSSALPAAAELLAEITRVVTPSASPAPSPGASPSFAHLASAAASPAASPRGSSYWPEQQQQQSPHASVYWAPQQQQQSPAASPEAEGAAASRWNAVAASRPASLSASPGGPASPLVSFGFAAASPGLAAPLSSPGCASPLGVERVDLPAPQFQLAVGPGSRFDHEAQLVLSELGQFADLERRTAAEFGTRVAADMAGLFALQSPLAA